MKVIKEDRSFGVFPMKVKCEMVKDKYGFAYGSKVDFCGSELEIEASDIKSHDWDKYPDYHGTDFGVICPICGKFITIDRDKIPASVKENAEKIRLHN